MQRIFTMRIRFFLLLSCISTIGHAMVMDNKYIPLLRRPYLFIDGTQFAFTSDVLVATSNLGFGAKPREKNKLVFSDSIGEIGLPEIDGYFDQGALADAIAKLGCPNPLPSRFQDKCIEWRMAGKRQFQGLAFGLHHQPLCWFTYGASWLFMRTESSAIYTLDPENLPSLADSQLANLDGLRRQMLSQLGLLGSHSSQHGFGDLDLYVRFGHEWDYEYKFRHIHAGLTTGLLIPSGVKRAIDEPTSIPYGGNGHWGLYAQLDALFEIKEDMKAGLNLYMNKRLPRTQVRRLPVNNEPQHFGATTGLARVNPGFTVAIEPYVVLEHLREGMGAAVYFTLTHHHNDSWRDERPDKEVSLTLQSVENLSAWNSEYFTLHLFYDFGRFRIIRDLAPIIELKWDVPTNFFAAKQVAKTNKVMFGIELAF